MNGMMFQSIQMVNKLTLKIDHNQVYNPDITKILPSSCQYVDNSYFSKYANEDLTNKNFKNLNPAYDQMRFHNAMRVADIW